MVERAQKVKNFNSEPFWFIQCKYKYMENGKPKYIDFKWNRERLFDEHSTLVLYQRCLVDDNNLPTEAKGYVTKVAFRE